MLVLRKVGNLRGALLKEIAVLTMEHRVQQSQVSVCTLTIRHADYTTLDDDLYTDFEIWYKGKLFLECTLEEYSLDTETGVATLIMWDFLGKLAREIGDSTLDIPNTFFAHSVQAVLRNRHGILELSEGVFAQIGDVTTLSGGYNKNLYPITSTPMSLDIRTLETRFAQFIKVIEQQDNTFFRLRGRPYDVPFISSRFMIDIGAFGEPAPFHLVQGQNLLRLTANRTENVRIRGIEAFGGPAGDGARKLNVRDAFNYNITAPFISGSGYSFEGDFTGAQAPGYIVRDAAPVNGYIIRKEYPEIKLTGTPTAAEIEEAGYALYIRTLRDFQKNVAVVEYTAEVVFDEEVYGPTFVDNFISKNTYVRYRTQDAILDTANNVYEDGQTLFEVDGEFRIVAYTVRYEGSGLQYTMTLTENTEKAQDNPQLQLYDTIAGNLQATDSGYGLAFTLTPASMTSGVTSHGTGVAADVVFDPFDVSGVNDAKLFSFSRDFIPPVYTECYWFVASVSPGYTWRVHQTPLNTAADYTTEVILRVKPIHDDWTTDSDADVRVAFFDIV